MQCPELRISLLNLRNRHKAIGGLKVREVDRAFLDRVKTWGVAGDLK